METKEIALGGLALVFQIDDTRCVYLVDKTGNAYTFFKYKARLIDLPLLSIQVALKKKSKEDAMEEIRVALAYGIKQGEVVVLHLGENTNDWDAFFKGEPFWDPEQLFRPAEKYNTEWYRSKIMKPTDKDMFGNQGSLYPNEKFLLMVSLTKDIPFEDIPWLNKSKSFFRKLIIN